MLLFSLLFSIKNILSEKHERNLTDPKLFAQQLYFSYSWVS